MHVDVIVGLSNLGPEGKPRDEDLTFDPMMEREAAEHLLAELGGPGARPPEIAAATAAPPHGPRSMLARVNVQLRARGMPTHAEPVEAPPWQPSLPGPLPLEALLRLRRVMAHHLARPGMAVAPLPPGEDPRADPVMEQAAARRDNHLIHHGDAEGFYLPVSFSQVVHDPTGTTIPGGSVGSSQRLAEELREIAPLMDLPVVEDAGEVPQHVIDRVLRDRDAAPFHLEEWAWLLHTQAAAASLRHGAAIVYR